MDKYDVWCIKVSSTALLPAIKILLCTFVPANIRQIYLFNWCMHGTDPRDFYALLSSQNPGIVKYIYQFIFTNL